MDRKSFISRAAVSAAALTLKPGWAGAEEKPTDTQQSFRNDWIQSFIKNLDDRLDESSRVKLMEACGRDCARRAAVKLAEANKGNVDGLVTALAADLGLENAKRDGDKITIVYPGCYCPMVVKIKDKLSKTWCNCSSGWLLEMFETAAEKPVTVEMIQSIKAGDPVCKFEVRV
jgi:predicted hydrocarbon binding protein